MDQSLLNKYFQDQCSEDELSQVLNWFQTEEGQAFVGEDIDRQKQKFEKNSGVDLKPDIASEKIFSRIQLHKKNRLMQRRWFAVRVASVILIAALLSIFLYWSDVTTSVSQNQNPAFTTYVTAAGQQKIFSLSDGTKIRLNEKSQLIIPKKTKGKRVVMLKGEAYFEVTHDADNPFVVETMGTTIEDLGTKFNVKSDSVNGQVQVAVVEGEVALTKRITDDAPQALITRHHFGTLRLSDGQITIEQTPVRNYLSWINNRLIFRGQSLRGVSRQLERLYQIHISFENESLKKLRLTANFEKPNLKKVLAIISHTLDVHFKMNNKQVVWIE